jgi:hypothetical protein
MRAAFCQDSEATTSVGSGRVERQETEEQAQCRMRKQRDELHCFTAPPGQVSITVLEGAARRATEREENRVIPAGDLVRVGR